MQTLLEIHDWISSPTMRSMGLCIDKNTVHSYIPVYESLFEPYRSRESLSILEIGISTGSSLILWERFFPQANIEGVDVQFQELAIDALNIYSKAKRHLGNSTEKKFTDTLGKYDIIIDDGSHEVHDQIKTFANLYPHLNENGIYVVEDIGGPSIETIKKEIPDGQLLDLRTNKGRWDDVMMIIKKEKN